MLAVNATRKKWKQTTQTNIWFATSQIFKITKRAPHIIALFQINTYF